MVNDLPTPPVKRSRFQIADHKLTGFWNQVIGITALSIVALFALTMVGACIKWVISAAHAVILQNGLLEVLITVGALAACAAALWYVRAHIMKALVQFVWNLGVIFHYGCFTAYCVIIPVFCYFVLATFSASITSFLTAPLGIKENYSGPDYPILPLMLCGVVAWVGYKSTRGIKARWLAKKDEVKIDKPAS